MEQAEYLVLPAHVKINLNVINKINQNNCPLIPPYHSHKVLLFCQDLPIPKAPRQNNQFWFFYFMKTSPLINFPITSFEGITKVNSPEDREISSPIGFSIMGKGQRWKDILLRTHSLILYSTNRDLAVWILPWISLSICSLAVLQRPQNIESDMNPFVDSIVYLQNSSVQGLTPNVTVFDVRTNQETSLNEAIGVGF